MISIVYWPRGCVLCPLPRIRYLTPFYPAAIDYITDLLSERGALLERLQHARSMLLPNHPALASHSIPPLWERTWHGGTGEGVLGDENEGAPSVDADSDDDY